MNESIALTEAVYYILLSLCSPLHGYGIMQRVDEMSAGRVKLAAGTLYGALNTLKERGWITLEGGTDGRRKDYAITEKGKDYRYEVAKSPIVALLAITEDNVSVGIVPKAAESSGFKKNPPDKKKK